MDPVEASSIKHNGKLTTTDELVDYTKQALEESAQKQRAAANYAELPAGLVPSPGDTLDLSSKGARTLPVEVIELIKDRVERLALSHNAQIVVPPEIVLCSRLFYLNLRWNGFKTFPESILQLTNLQTLDVSRNRITAMPDGIRHMSSLKFLAFTNNQVARLPVCLGDMPSLTKLKFDDNPIEFPPPEEYTPNATAQAKPGFDGNTYICTQVKKYMRQAVVKDRQKVETEADISESNLDTPRPPKRTATGRFPVKPSMSGIENAGDFIYKTDSPFLPPPPPPIPQKSRARDSLILQPAMRRPGLAPLNTDGMATRSQSEAVTSTTAVHRSKRLGFVPRKISGPGSANAVVSDTRMLKPLHFRGASSSSALGTSSGGETSSGPASPIDGQTTRPWARSNRLSSLPEDRRVSRITSPTFKSARLIVFSLHQLNRSIDDAVRIIGSGTPRHSGLERLKVNAAANATELDRQLHILMPVAESEGRETSNHVRVILKKSRQCLRAYATVISEIRSSVRKMALYGEPMYLRALMLQIYSAVVELRNACSIQEAALATPPSKGTWSTQPASERTVTPTQARPLSSKRMRGKQILAGMAKAKSPNSMSHSNILTATKSGRQNMMPGLGSATPRSGESFGPVQMSRSNTVHSHSTDSDEERQFERIYLNLQHVCDLADQTLPNCRLDFFARKEGAARSMQATAARAWTLALNKCDIALHSLDQLKNRLARLKLKDPALRNSREFWHTCDIFVRSWFDLGSEMKNLGNQGLDIGAIKVVLRPVQKAVKDVSHLFNQSPLYKGALKTQAAMPPPMPPTPLSAALGPAAQATVPSMPGMVSHADYYYSYSYAKDRDKERDRADMITSKYTRR